MFTRALNFIAVAGVAAFIVVCSTAQFLRDDLDWVSAPLSYYLEGPGGIVVKAAYVALSAALCALGVGFFRTLVVAARSGVPLLLFVVSGVTLSVTAFTQIPVALDPAGFHTFVHGAAAMTTFLCVTVAMLLQSWRLRGDPRWRTSFGFAFALAVAAFAALWIYALTHEIPRGLMQKIVIALILVWLAWAALALRRFGQ